MLETRDFKSLLAMNNRPQPFHMWPHFDLRPPALPPVQPLRPLALLAASSSATASVNPHLSPISPVNHHQFHPEFHTRETASSPTPTEGKLNYDCRKWRCNDSCGSHNIHFFLAKKIEQDWKLPLFRFGYLQWCSLHFVLNLLFYCTILNWLKSRFKIWTYFYSAKTAKTQFLTQFSCFTQFSTETQ